MFRVQSIEDLKWLVKEEQEESIHLDFKKSYEHSAGTVKIAKAVSAFANSSGGTILYGVKEDQGRADELVGLERGEHKTHIQNVLDSHVSPELSINYEIFQLPDKQGPDGNPKEVLAVEIPKSPRRPHKVHNKGYYKRVADVSRPVEMSEPEIERLYQERENQEGRIDDLVGKIEEELPFLQTLPEDVFEFRFIAIPVVPTGFEFTRDNAFDGLDEGLSSYHFIPKVRSYGIYSSSGIVQEREKQSDYLLGYEFVGFSDLGCVGHLKRGTFHPERKLTGRNIAKYLIDQEIYLKRHLTRTDDPYIGETYVQFEASPRDCINKSSLTSVGSAVPGLDKMLGRETIAHEDLVFRGRFSTKELAGSTVAKEVLEDFGHKVDIESLEEFPPELIENIGKAAEDRL